jgi:hypothetical protein
MRALLVLSVVLTMGCWGNWSNEDLVFADALPSSSELQVRSVAVLAQRMDGLMVGDVSAAVTWRGAAATQYNGLLAQLLGLVDQVQRISPTTRTSDSRTWGPYGDSNNAGREVQLQLTREGEDYAWSIESRPAAGEWLGILTGSVKVTAPRTGSGSISVPVKDFRDVVKVDPMLEQLDALQIDYETSQRADVTLTPRPGATFTLSPTGYTYRRLSDGSQSLRFSRTTAETELEELEVTTSWKATGAGRADSVVRKGTRTGERIVECWAADATVVHYAESWDGGVVSGPASDCEEF